MTEIINDAGTEIEFDAAVNYMDDDIREQLHMLADEYGSPHTAQQFFNDYCVMHREKFGDEFEPNKANPVW